MSQPHVEPDSYRNPSDDAWWRRALDATGATMQLRTYEQTGQEVTWSDAVMNASAAASMGWRKNNERWSDLPKGQLGDVADGFADRLSEEYMGDGGRIPYMIDTASSLPNVRANMASGAIDQTLNSAATRIVTAADPGERGERWDHPDPETVSAVRNAMSQQMLDGRNERLNEVGNPEQNFAYRLGYATADAGVKAMNASLATGHDSELARSVQHTLGAQSPPRLTAPTERTDGAAAATTTGSAQTKPTGLGARG